MTTYKFKEIIPLEEYVQSKFAKEKFSEGLEIYLCQNYSTQLTVDPPSFKTDYQWRLTSQGWVGFIPCNSEMALSLKPKVELSNIFRMLEYGYKLKSIQFLENLIDCKSLEEFYERLANILAKRVLDRGRKGFYRSYISQTDNIPFIKGRINIRQSIEKPWDINLQCHYQEHTSDIEENQILSWTLSRIACSGMCTERVLPTVRRAYHSIRGLAALLPYHPKDCINRLYNRLNEDYRPMHALCRFFLEHSGPSHELGDHTMIPFLIDMERLYELFVAEWLKNNLPSGISLEIQEKVDIGEANILTFKIDLVLYNSETKDAVCVLDTKYKSVEKPSTDDVSQVVTYATIKKCNKAFLIYPKPLSSPYDGVFGTVNVKSLYFSLSGDLEQAGMIFRETLLKNIGL